MKKITLLLAIILAASGVVWAQVIPGIPDPTVTGGTQHAGDIYSALRPAGEKLFDRMNVVPTISTEARYSAGIFGSMVDDFIGVNSYDPQVGTFLFLGGYPTDYTSTVDETDNLTDGTGSKDYEISVGFAKTIKSIYMGLYYGGSFVYASGDSFKPESPTKDRSYYRRYWNNDVALLIGTQRAGAFRLDMALNTYTRKNIYDGDITGKIREDAPMFALTWGGMKLAGLDPYVTMGFKLPDQMIWGDHVGDKYYEAKGKEGGAFGFQAGVNYDFNDHSSVSGDMVILGQFGSKVSGDRTIANTLAPGVLSGSGDSFEVKTDGIFLMGFRTAYKHTVNFRKFSFGFKPNLSLAFFNDKSDNISGDYIYDAPDYKSFELKTGVDMGIKYQPSRVFAFYTGAGLTFFDLQTTHWKGGTAKYDNRYWFINGISWDPEKLAKGTNLGFGMTITPVNNLVIGFGLNTVLDKLIGINLREMKFDTNGTFWQDAIDANNSAGAAAAFFKGWTFDLTVSYKF